MTRKPKSCDGKMILKQIDEHDGVTLSVWECDKCGWSMSQMEAEKVRVQPIFSGHYSNRRYTNAELQEITK